MSPKRGASVAVGAALILMTACASAQTVPTAGDQTPTATTSNSPIPTPTITDKWAPGSVAVGPDGTVYTTDCVLGHIYAVSTDGDVTAFAGTGVSSTAGGVPVEGASRLETPIHCPAGIEFDAAGNLIIVDHASNRIRSIAPDGTVTTIAGGGPTGTSSNDGVLGGDGGPALEATLQEPTGIGFDGAGNLYFTDRDNHAVRRIDVDGTIETVAGTGDPGFSGDGGPATDARIMQPVDVAVDAAGNVYFSDAGNNRVRRVDPDGIITTIAGTGEDGFSGDGGPAVEAQISAPADVIIGPDGAVIFTDGGNGGVRRINADGTIESIAGTGEGGYSGDGGPAVEAQLLAGGIAFDSDGNLLIGDTDNHRIRIVSPDGTIDSYAPRDD